MSRIREGRGEVAEGFDFAGPCFVCGEPVERGAFWMGYTHVSVCSTCVWDGRLGLLVGDAARDSHDVARMLDHTAREAWRALALAYERERLADADA
jgi:hypothetical protein